MLALIDGKTQRANRDLDREKAELAALVAACPTLRERALGDLEWELPDLYDSLEFLSEVQAYTGPVLLEWPEEGRLRVTAMTTAEKMSVKLRAARDWFNVSGELRIDENLVMDLRELLERAGRTQGRFIQLDDGRFLAMTEQLRRQLDRLGSLTEGDGKGRRVHRMAASAVEEALEGAGKLDADKQWREQIEKIRAAGRHEPKVPSTLQAELARLSGRRLPLAVPAGALGRRGLPCRRHGSGQDGPGPGGDAGARAQRRHRRGRPDIRLPQLGGGDRAVRPGAECPPVRQCRRPGGAGQVAGADGRAGDQLRPAQPGSGAAVRKALANGGAGRGAGDQERLRPSGRRPA